MRKYSSDLRIEDFETINCEGYTCPWCNASDRERLYALYFDGALGRNASGSFRLLDIAPAGALSAHIRKKYPITYRTADLFMEGVDDRVDITNMSCYRDGSFDAFICSHVLEHIPDDQKAMAELIRILKPGGWGIAMVPISLALPEIREDFSKTSEAERWRYFGQNDHCRVYCREGFLARLNQVGFKTLDLGSDFFGLETFTRCGIARRSMLYIAEK